METLFEVTSTAIIHEVLDDEVIIANLDSGIYYSIRGSGVLIWQLLLSNYSSDAITSLFAHKLQVNASEAIQAFIDRILQEGLLTTVQTKSSLPHESSFMWPAAFIPPSFEKYEEMKNLLMLDPIHEVDEQGWPSKS